MPLNCHASGVSLTFLPAISRSHTQVYNSHALLQIQCQILPNSQTNRQIADAVFGRDARAPLNYGYPTITHFLLNSAAQKSYLKQYYVSILPNPSTNSKPNGPGLTR